MSPRLLRRWRARPTALVALTIVTVLLTAACGSDSQATPAASDTPTSDTSIPSGLTLTIAEQSSGESIPWNLSHAGDGAAYGLKFANFNGGTAVIEALLAGAADVGSLGEAPLPIAIDGGVDDLVAIAGLANPGSSGNYYLVAQPGSSIKTVADLRGKKVAYPPGTGRHMIVAAILADNGLSLSDDVKPVELAGSEVAPAFSSGAVDAAIVLAGEYFKVGSPPILDDGSGFNYGINVLVVRRDTLGNAGKMAAVADYVRHGIQANAWKASHTDDWIQASYVKQQGLTTAQGRQLVDEAGIGSYYPLDDDFTAALQAVAHRLHDTGTLKASIDVAPYLDGRFDAIVTEQNQANGVVLRPLG